MGGGGAQLLLGGDLVEAKLPERENTPVGLTPLLGPRTSHSLMGDGLFHSMAQRDTWDRFYTQQDTAGTPRHFNWFFDYAAISGLLLPALQRCGSPEPNASLTRVLDVGCGTSDLGLGLYRDSPHPVHISCVDVSPVAIRSLQRLLQEVPPPRHPLSQLHLHVADATDLDGGGFGDGSFHLVLDKGTCDSLLRCTQGPGQAGQLVAECLRVLRPGGCLLQFSDEDPDARVPFLEQAGGAGVTVQEVGHFGGICYYVYTLCQLALETPTNGALD
ncbi:citrate synthase-lysine N-methyltransferase CSKMT, mitochondrial isoform X1 [Dermochelys coriacea]|uniref:citrate synthase-lysine N-methyltransferase CSKMT, mitochondrial isoform X1 n=1 Tax=Dermochelys coriacea TaxID=27794 RepID=UPI0018E7EB51|nr:citrate synthase-lysine N-methyltransferase CSKMT, mitochondrial isoform X1 [Dermochelys coriacea]